MKFHFEHCTKFKAKVSSEIFKAGCEREDIKFLLGVCMHTADIANPAKPMKICLQWTEQVMEEFFRQGDLERQMGMPDVRRNGADSNGHARRRKTCQHTCEGGFSDTWLVHRGSHSNSTHGTGYDRSRQEYRARHSSQQAMDRLPQGSPAKAMVVQLAELGSQVAANAGSSQRKPTAPCSRVAP